MAVGKRKTLTIKVVSNRDSIQITVSPPVLEFSKDDQDQLTIKSNKDVMVRFVGNGWGPFTKDPRPKKGYRVKKATPFDGGKVRGDAMRTKYRYSVIYVEPDSKPDPKYVYTLDPRFWVN